VAARLPQLHLLCSVKAAQTPRQVAKQKAEGSQVKWFTFESEITSAVA